MKPLNIPAGYQQVMPYLIVQNADGFIEFMCDVFDAVEKMRVMRDEDVIMHAEISVGESCIMLADTTEQFEVRNAGMFIYVDDCDTRYQKALDNGATSIMPPANQEYGRSAGVLDPFGNTWWVTTA